MGKIHGFTLAETLITLGIIGVVAALTLPILIQNVQQKILISRWKKAYADLNQAFVFVKSQDEFEKYYNCSEYQCYQNIANLIMDKYISKTENRDFYAGDYKKYKYKTILGDDFIIRPTFHAAYNVNNMTFFIWNFLPHSITIYVDVNRVENPPNVLGKDLFAVVITNDEIHPIGQFSDGDFCKGFGNNYINGVQSIYYDDEGKAKSIPLSNYAGLGCSYDYLYK